MKHIQNIFTIALCLLFIVLGSACNKETSSKAKSKDAPASLKMGEILVGSQLSATKCAGDDEELIASDIPYVCSTGDTVFLSVYVSDMEEAPEAEDATKSTVIDGTKFGTADGYKSFYNKVYKDGESSYYESIDGSGNKTTMDGVPVSYVSSAWRFGTESAAASYYWPADDKDLYFCSYAPKSEFESGGTVSNWTWDKTNHKLTFTYTSPDPTSDKLDAEKQKDILVGVDAQGKDTHSGSVVLNVKHPLVAVKLILGNVFGTIEYISFKNFYNSGVATVTKDAISWNVSTSTKKTFIQKFDFYTVGKDTTAATGRVSLDATTNKTRTFMFIPQLLASDAAMELKMGNTNHAEPILFTDIAKKEPKLADWSAFAGKVLTLRISSVKANLVSVNVTDEVDGCTKKNVKITNDGRSPIYIRAVLVGNWVNASGDVLTSWHESDPYGVFDTTFPNPLPSNWEYNSKDKFYYYKKIIPSTGVVKQNLFSTFTLDKTPESTTTEAEKQIKGFDLAILVQAVIAEADKSKYSMKTAWNLSDADIASLGITDDLD